MAQTGRFVGIVAIATVGAGALFWAFPRRSPQLRGTSVTASESEALDPSTSPPAPPTAKDDSPARPRIAEIERAPPRGIAGPPAEAHTSKPASLQRPSGIEREGYLQNVYDRWSVGSEDVVATSQAKEFLTKQWDNLDIHPKAQTVLCTPDVCRGHFAFDELSSLYRMSQIPKSDALEAVSGAPEREPDGSFSLVVYWARSGSSLSDVPRDVVRR
jgi:hypothetical protein